MKIRKLFLATIAGIGTLLMLGFVFRNLLVNLAFDYVKVRIEKAYHADLNVRSIQFSGYNTVSVNGLTLQPEKGDTLLTVHDAELHLSLSELFKGRIGFNEVNLWDISVSIYNTPNRNNLMFFNGRDVQNPISNMAEIAHYRALAERSKNKLLQVLNIAFTIKNFHFNYLDSSHAESINAPEINYDLRNLSALVINQKTLDTFQISSFVQEKDRKYEFAIEHLGQDTLYLPFLNAPKGLKSCFQQIRGYVSVNEDTDELQSTFDISAVDFHINHWRLAKSDVVFPSIEFKGLFRINDKNIELDSSSCLTLNQAKFQLFVNYHHDTGSVFSMTVHMPETVSDTFFHALPAGAFNTLNGISCSGTLTYDMQFQLNTLLPDSLIFLSALNRKDFHIIHYGEENFGRVNEPFVYSAYDHDQFVRSIEIGPENSSYNPLERISPLLVKCVLQSEDPSFMNHHGFLPESFRESIVQDYREKRFARGGSTISMQFVKNVFLNRDKTVSRKAQEALIVYLIENLGLISKERMLEIYLNVIEWAPNVYGIGEASKFYFNKTPAQLNLQECLFLAAIIPNPKYFKYQFNKDGHVKSYMADYFKLLSTRMESRGLISAQDLKELVPDVKLSGPAARFVMPGDSLPSEEELWETE